MKKLLIIPCFVLFLLGGCAGNSSEETTNPENSSSLDSTEEATPNKSDSTNDAQETNTDEATEVSSSEEKPAASESSERDDKVKEKDSLSQYSSEQIEYARVWLQLGPNQQIDGLYVRLIPAGTPLNPDDETSLNYPEDVVQLAGSRLIDGSVTYSGNGDGTINVYNVPLRWDGIYPAGEVFYKEIIDNTEHVAIGRGTDEDIIRLINLITIQE